MTYRFIPSDIRTVLVAALDKTPEDAAQSIRTCEHSSIQHTIRVQVDRILMDSEALDAPDRVGGRVTLVVKSRINEDSYPNVGLGLVVKALYEEPKRAYSMSVYDLLPPRASKEVFVTATPQFVGQMPARHSVDADDLLDRSGPVWATELTLAKLGVNNLWVLDGGVVRVLPPRLEVQRQVNPTVGWMIEDIQSQHILNQKFGPSTSEAMEPPPRTIKYITPNFRNL